MSSGFPACNREEDRVGSRAFRTWKPSCCRSSLDEISLMNSLPRWLNSSSLKLIGGLPVDSDPRLHPSRVHWAANGMAYGAEGLRHHQGRGRRTSAGCVRRPGLPHGRTCAPSSEAGPAEDALEGGHNQNSHRGAIPIGVQIYMALYPMRVTSSFKCLLSIPVFVCSEERRHA